MAQLQPLVYVCSDASDLRRDFLEALREAGVRVHQPLPAPLGASLSAWQRKQTRDGIDAANVILVVSMSSGRWPSEELSLVSARLKSDSAPMVVPVLLGHSSRKLLPEWCQDFEGVTLNARPPYGAAYERLLAFLHVPGFDPAVQSSGSNSFLSSLQVSGFRCFKGAQYLQFSSNGEPFSRWSVILGDNGVGKTTLLRGIAQFSHIPSPEELPKQADLVLELATDPPRTITSGQVSQSSDLPTIYAYGAGRGVHTARLAPTSVHPAATLFDDGAALPDAEEWWLQTDYAVRVSNDEAARWRLERVRQVLVKLLPDVNDISVRLDDKQQPRLMADTIHGRVYLRDLSLGYNTALTWVIDLARRMFERYPNAPDPLAEPAVVLVDEIDLHLHPRWQRALLQDLDRIFSKTQFIVTAHSPLIVQAAPNANLALLRWEGDQVVIDNDVDYIRKWRVDQILASELFGEQPTHAPEVEALIEKKLELASKPTLTEEEQLRLHELEDELAQLPTASNPSDIDAMQIIREAAEAIKAKSRA